MPVIDAERLLARLRPARARIDLDRLAANYHAIAALAGFAPGQEAVVIEHGLTPVVSTPETLDLALATAAAGRRRLTVHLKVDTGMGRLGFPSERLDKAAASLAGPGRA